MDLVKPVHVSDNSRLPSTFRHHIQSCIGNSGNVNEKGNDSSVGTHPEMDQKSLLASPSYHDESRREVEEDPSDSPRRLSYSSPVSGCPG